MKDIKIAVIGGDMRQCYIATALKQDGCTVSAYGIKGELSDICATLEEAIENASFIILPYPVSPDGVYLNAVCEECNIKISELFSLIRDCGIKMTYGGGFKSNIKELAAQVGISIFDYGVSEALKIKNALCTAEGAIEVAMRELPINIHGSRSTVLGYGRIGRLLSCRLKALGSEVRTVSRSAEALASAGTDGMLAMKLSRLDNAVSCSDVIFNTAPALVLDQKALLCARSDCLIIDLASAPGGVDFNEAERLGIKVIWALSLPGKCSPKSAAMIICDEILNHIENTFDLTLNS